MSLKDELNAIKDVHEYEEKFESNEYLTAVAKTWADNWVEEVLTIIESGVKKNVKDGEYEKCGDHNIVHKAITLYDEDWGKLDSFYEPVREFHLFGVLDKSNFTANKEFIDYLDGSFDRKISNNGIEFYDGSVKTFFDEYGGSYSRFGTTGICLYLTEGRGIYYIDRKVEKEIPTYSSSNNNIFMNFFNPKHKKEPEKRHLYTSYKTLKIGDIGQYVIDRFNKRAPEYGFKVDVYVERKNKYVNNVVKVERCELKDLMSELDISRTERDYLYAEFNLKIDFSIEF